MKPVALSVVQNEGMDQVYVLMSDDSIWEPNAWDTDRPWKLAYRANPAIGEPDLSGVDTNFLTREIRNRGYHVTKPV